MLLASAAPTPAAAALAVRCEVVELQTHKDGNNPHECEDSAQYHADDGWFALSDGAGEGIFSREWSRLLVDSFIRERPDLADPVLTSAWLERCRRAWFEQIDYTSLGWAHRARVDRHGSGATLLTLRFFRAADTGKIAFHVQAVGDSCLFWVRDGQCLAFFPLADSGVFEAHPDLFSTHGLDAPTILQAGACCAPTDCFLLATDAVARWFYRMIEAGQSVDWDCLRKMNAANWRRHIDALRKSHNRHDPHGPIPLDNDDCTLLVVSVTSEATVV